MNPTAQTLIFYGAGHTRCTWICVRKPDCQVVLVVRSLPDDGTPLACSIESDLMPAEIGCLLLTILRCEFN